MAKRKLSPQDEAAIKEFEELTLDETIRKEMFEYEKNRQENTHARFVPWNVYFESNEETIIEKIRNKFKFQFI